MVSSQSLLFQGLCVSGQIYTSSSFRKPLCKLRAESPEAREYSPATFTMPFIRSLSEGTFLIPHSSLLLPCLFQKPAFWTELRAFFAIRTRDCPFVKKLLSIHGHFFAIIHQSVNTLGNNIDHDQIRAYSYC